MGLVRRLRRVVRPASNDPADGGFPHRKAPFARAQKLVAAGLVDLDWYRATADGKFPRAIDAAYHFYTQSRTQFPPHPILATSQQYDTKQYLDAVATYVDGFDEQWKFDKQLGPLPHPLFDDFKYIADHPDAAHYPGGPRGHFAAHAKPSDTLPLRDDWDSAPVTVAAWRAALHDAVTDIVRIRKLRAKTPSRTWDFAADQNLRQSYHDEALRKSGPLVTVVMPVLNRADTIASAIASVRSQTYVNWELIVVNDGSTDGTDSIVSDLVRQEPRVRLVNTNHQGVCAARNRGIRDGSGKYIAFLDSDDRWRNDFLEVMVAFAERHHHRAVCSATHTVVPSGDQFLSVDASADDLLDMTNVYNMSSLLVERDVLTAIGGFDESLRRYVDYDLAINISKYCTIKRIPIIGVEWANDPQIVGRISTSEATSWDQVVRQKYSVHWPGPRDISSSGQPDAAVLVIGSDDPRVTAATVQTLSPSTDLELAVTIAEARTHLWTHATTAALMGGLSGIAWTRHASWVGKPLHVNQLCSVTTAPTVIVCDAGVEMLDGCLATLAQCLDSNPNAAVVQPVVLDAAVGTLSAGYVLPDVGDLPIALLGGHPVEDVQRLGAVLEVGAADERCFAVRRHDVETAQGLNLMLSGGWSTRAFSQRDHEHRLTLVPTSAQCVRTATPLTASLPGTAARTNRERLQSDNRVAAALRASRWMGPQYSDYLRALQFDVAAWQVVPGEQLRDLPRTRPVPQFATTTQSTGRPLRWAIHHMTPPGFARRWWGDWYFAEDLAAALRDQGQEVVLDWHGSRHRPTSHLDDVVVVLHGYDRVAPTPGAINILWIISHPRKITPDQLEGFDLVYAASEPWARRASDLFDIEVRPLLQAFDPNKFHPDLAGNIDRSGVVFVGNGRQRYERPVVRDAVAAGVPLRVWGQYWDAQLPKEFLAGRSYPNRDLGALYAKSSVVLADHFPEMRAEGFISNRVFEAVACGAHVICDEVAELDKLFGDSVTVASTPHDVERAWVKIQQDSRRVRQHPDLAGHSFASRAATLIADVTALS